MQAKGFFAALFDYSFSAFITPRIIKILYVLATVVIALWTLLLVLAAFNASSSIGLLALIVIGPLFFLFSIIYARVLLELIIVFFRINANVQDIHDGHGGKAVQPAPIPEAPSGAVPVVAPSGPPPETRPEPTVAAPMVEAASEGAPSAPSAPAPEQAAVRYCENCGAERSPGGRFCTVCGHE